MAMVLNTMVDWQFEVNCHIHLRAYSGLQLVSPESSTYSINSC